MFKRKMRAEEDVLVGMEYVEVSDNMLNKHYKT